MTTWTERGILQIWNALSSVSMNGEWQVNLLAALPKVRLLAGRTAGNREAILFKLEASLLPKDMMLPKGSGFDVIRVQDGALEGGEPLLALVRAPEGADDLFTMMAVDVLRHVEARGSETAKTLLDAFLSRVTDWQTFMSADRSRPLSTERQIGLQGELVFLEKLLDLIGNAQTALDMWQGPFRAAQDFHIGNGAVEVKATASIRSFKAKINSIDQLDTQRAPLFLLGVRFVEDPDGLSLCDQVARLKDRFGAGGAARLFEAVLFACRYFKEHEPSYARLLTVTEWACLAVEEDFPCLRRGTLPLQITAATYDLDLATIEIGRHTEHEMFRALGVS